MNERRTQCRRPRRQSSGFGAVAGVGMNEEELSVGDLGGKAPALALSQEWG